MTFDLPSFEAIESANYACFDPTTFDSESTCTAWFEPDAQSIAINGANGNVKQWNNRLQNQTVTSFASATTGAQPIYIPQHSANGLPALQFDGVAHAMVGSGATGFLPDVISYTGGGGSTASFTWLLVASCSSVTQDSSTSYANPGIFADAGGYAGIHVRNRGGTTPVILGGAFSSIDEYVTTGQEFPITLGQLFLATFSLDATHNFQFQKNKQTPITLSGSIATASQTSNYFFGQGNATGGFFAGQIQLLLCFRTPSAFSGRPSALSNLSGLQDVIMSRWNISP